jgi:hypothetical protein
MSNIGTKFVKKIRFELKITVYHKNGGVRSIWNIDTYLPNFTCHIPGSRNLDALRRENLKSTAFFTFTYLKSHISEFFKSDICFGIFTLHVFTLWWCLPKIEPLIVLQYPCALSINTTDATETPHPGGLLCNPFDEGDYYYFFPLLLVMEHRWNETDRVKPKYSGGKPVPVPLCPPQIPRGRQL